MIIGSATPDGTASYAERHADSCGAGHFHQGAGLTWSSIGIGTYLGGEDEETDAQVAAAVERVVRHGINVVDSAINYRHERAECSIGRALERLIDTGGADRSELILCSKGGYLPHPDRGAWFKREFAGRMGITEADLVDGVNCMHPAYLADQLEQSCANLGVTTLDVYYVHNPEHHAKALGPEAFDERLEAAFARLEQAVQEGRIAMYGLATWNGLRTPPDSPDHIGLERAVRAAERAAGGSDHHFQAVQLPFNLAMPEAAIQPTQPVAGDSLPALNAAVRLGLEVTLSRSISAGKISTLPDNLISALGSGLETNSQRALQFARSALGVTSALAGMKQPAHLDQALAVVRTPPLSREEYAALFRRG